jgi:hypothetical protein
MDGTDVFGTVEPGGLDGKTTGGKPVWWAKDAFASQ